MCYRGYCQAILHESAELHANQICIVNLQPHIYTCLSSMWENYKHNTNAESRQLVQPIKMVREN